MDISRLKTFVDRRLGIPINKIDITEEYIQDEVDFAEEMILDGNRKFLNGQLRDNWIRDHVLASTKINLGRTIYGRGIDSDIDGEALLNEGYKEIKTLYI